MTAARYVTLTAGALSEVAAVEASAGAGDEGKIPALNADGHIDPSMLGAVTAAVPYATLCRFGTD